MGDDSGYQSRRTALEWEETPNTFREMKRLPVTSAVVPPWSCGPPSNQDCAWIPGGRLLPPPGLCGILNVAVIPFLPQDNMKYRWSLLEMNK